MQDLASSDMTLLDLLRQNDGLTVVQLSDSMGVTATAVRQRLNRLMAMNYVDRASRSEGRGRPTHHYRLTAEGRRKSGENFADLAVALWQEVRRIGDPAVRRGLLQRLSKRMADMYGTRITGDTIQERMEALIGIYARRQIPFSMSENEAGLPVLTAHACPYPGLAEQDRSLCSMERMMFAELLGEDIRLDQCRLDGPTCCTFEVKLSESANEPAG